MELKKWTLFVCLDCGREGWYPDGTLAYCTTHNKASMMVEKEVGDVPSR
jgi:hypothetical protein